MAPARARAGGTGRQRALGVHDRADVVVGGVEVPAADLARVLVHEQRRAAARPCDRVEDRHGVLLPDDAVLGDGLHDAALLEPDALDVVGDTHALVEHAPAERLTIAHGHHVDVAAQQVVVGARGACDHHGQRVLGPVHALVGRAGMHDAEGRAVPADVPHPELARGGVAADGGFEASTDAALRGVVDERALEHGAGADVVGDEVGRDRAADGVGLRVHAREEGRVLAVGEAHERARLRLGGAEADAGGADAEVGEEIAPGDVGRHAGRRVERGR